MIQIKYIFTLFAIALLLSACETTIDYDLPQEPSKITIDTKLLVDDTPIVHVFTSVSALSRQDPSEAVGAEVMLYENGVFVSELPMGQSPYGQPIYTSNYPIKANQVYKVQVALPNYTTAFGEGLAKEAIPITNVVFDSISHDLAFTFQDPPTKEDYYLITARAITNDYSIYYSTNDVVIDFFEDNSFDDPFGGSGEKFGEKGYMSDQYFNGKTKTVRITIEEDLVYFPEGRFYIELWRISEDLYNHQRTKAIAWTSENPFSEPVQIHSNIENGYGIVGTAAVSREQFYP